MGCTDLEAKFVSRLSIDRGFSMAGVVNGMMLSGGMFWSRIKGGYNLYRGKDDPASIDWSFPVGASAGDAVDIRNIGGISHDADSTYWYGLRAVGAGGVENTDTSQVFAVYTDNVGDLKAPVPGGPFGLSVDPIAGGSFRLSWSHFTEPGLSPPTHFRVFHDNGSGTVDYVNFIAEQAASRNTNRASVVVGPYAHNTHVTFGVRAAIKSGTTLVSIEENTVTVSGFADAQGPPAPSSLILTCLSDQQ